MDHEREQIIILRSDSLLSLQSIRISKYIKVKILIPTPRKTFQYDSKNHSRCTLYALQPTYTSLSFKYYFFNIKISLSIASSNNKKKKKEQQYNKQLLNN